MRSSPNAAAFADGWLRTGDQGFLDGDGYVTLTGRIKEQINRGGEKLSPAEIEEALAAHPAVAEAVAFPVPHPTLGEEVAAAVVLRPGAHADPGELRRFAGGRLAGFKVPRRVLAVDRLPRSPTGKLQRVLMAERLGLARRSRPRPPAQGDGSPVQQALSGVVGRGARAGGAESRWSYSSAISS